jgi:hypothetical protein
MPDCYYLNEDHTIRPCSLYEWSEQLEKLHRSGNNHVAEETINGMWISTVWIGLNHGYGEDEPLLFETMVFPENRYDQNYCDRYSTWSEAVNGHKKAAQWVLDGCKRE